MTDLVPLVQPLGPDLFRLSARRREAERGDEGDRTLNPRLAKPVLSQLSYVPVGREVRGQTPEASSDY